MSKKIKRIEIIDVAKCIAIFMVVLGHSATNNELLSNPPLLYKVIYSIHMPLFFFLTGLSIKPRILKTKEEWILFIRKNILTIVIPYLIWSLIYCNFNFDNVLYILYASWQALGKTNTVTSLWYLSCLFITRIIVQIIINIVNSKKEIVYLIPAILCLIIGLLFPYLELGYPWGFNIAFIASCFVLMGIALRLTILKLAVAKGIHLLSLLLISIALYIGVVLIRNDGFEILMMCKGSYGNPIYFLLCCIIGGFIVLLISMILKRGANEWLNDISIEPLIYMGQHTMGIFLIHKPFLQNIFIPLFESIIPNGIFIPRILASIVVIGVSLILCYLIEHYIPELVGIFSKDIIQGKLKRN